MYATASPNGITRTGTEPVLGGIQENLTEFYYPEEVRGDNKNRVLVNCVQPSLISWALCCL